MDRPEAAPPETIRYIVVQHPPRGGFRFLPPLLILAVAAVLIVHRALSPDWHWDPTAAATVQTATTTPAQIPPARVEPAPADPAAKTEPAPESPSLAEAVPAEPLPALEAPTDLLPLPAPAPSIVAAEPTPPINPPKAEPKGEVLAHAALDDIQKEAQRRRAERQEAERVQEQEERRQEELAQREDQRNAARFQFHAPLDAQRAEHLRRFDELIREQQREQQAQIRELVRRQQAFLKEVQRAARAGVAPSFPGVPVPDFSFAAPPGRIVRYQFRWGQNPEAP